MGGNQKTWVETHSRVTTLTSGGAIDTQTDTTTLSGLNPDGTTVAPAATTWTRLFTSTANTILTTSPFGRKTTVTLDPSKERILSMQAGLNGAGPVDLYPTTYQYVAGPNNAGKLWKTTVNGRVVEWTYGADGFVSLIASPTGTVAYTRDLLGRPTQISLPGSRTVAQAYDSNDNALSVTPPGKPAHGFTPTWEAFAPW